MIPNPHKEPSMGENINSLVKKYPRLFAQHVLPPEESAMCWGITAQDGWYHLLDDACKLIQDHVDWFKSKQVEFVQVKEKMGGLVIHADDMDEYTRAVIQMVWLVSLHTCEICGDRGTRCNDRSRVMVRCRKCRKGGV